MVVVEGGVGVSNNNIDAVISGFGGVIGDEEGAVIFTLHGGFD